MRVSAITIIFLLLHGMLLGQIVTIPDPNLKAELLAAGPNNQTAEDIDGNFVVIDTNGNAEIEVNEALAIAHLRIYDDAITNLTGVEAFTNLRGFECYSEFVTDVSVVSSFTQVEYLSFGTARITELNLSGFNNLTFLRFTNNYVQSTVNLSNLPNLVELQLWQSDITLLNLTNLPSLEVLNARQNEFLTIDLSGLTALRDLNLDRSKLVELDLQGLISLEYVRTRLSNDLETILANDLPNLKRIYSAENNLLSVNVDGSSSLETLLLSFNQINEFSVVGLNQLDTLGVSHNNIQSLNLDGADSIRYLWAESNLLTDIDLTGKSEVIQLDLWNNPLTEIDLSMLESAEYINVSGCLLSSVILGTLPELTELRLNNNLLIDVDASNLTNLRELTLNYNQLTTFNANNLINLRTLAMGDNNLETLFIKNGIIPGENTNFNVTDNPNLRYICTDEEEIAYAQQLTIGNPDINIGTYCNFDPGGIFYTVQGESLLDDESDGCDVNDLGIGGVGFNIDDGTNTEVVFAGSSGVYYLPLNSGNYSIGPFIENPQFWNVSPVSFEVDFPTDPSPYQQEICVEPNGVQPDLEVVVVPRSAARPGFSAFYRLVCRNKGNQTMSGEITLSYENEIMDFVQSFPNFDDQSASTYTWNYSGLMPFETLIIDIEFELNSPQDDPPVNNGDELTFIANIDPVSNDIMPLDNEFVLNQIVVGSLDPNDKRCLQGETITPEMVGEYIHYLIRFENIGTFPAENVVVKDIIDTDKFQMDSFRPLDSSHDFVTRINDNIVEFIFEGINLPFQTGQNEGYVLFKIKTSEDLVLGDVFTNSAEIFFDFNFPIVTNTTETEVTELLSIGDVSAKNYFRVSPIPADDVLFIQNKQNLQIRSIAVYNLLGQRVGAITDISTSVNISNLTSGNYFLEIQSELGTNYLRFIKK